MFRQTHMWPTIGAPTHTRSWPLLTATHTAKTQKNARKIQTAGVKILVAALWCYPDFFHALFSWAVSCIKNSFTLGELIPPSDLNMFELIWPKIFVSNGIIIQSRVEYDGCTHSEIHGLMDSNSNTNLNRHKYTLPWVGGWSRQFFPWTMENDTFINEFWRSTHWKM